MPETIAEWNARQIQGAPLTSREAHELAGWFRNRAADEESRAQDGYAYRFSRASKYLRAMAKRLMEEERTAKQ